MPDFFHKKALTNYISPSVQIGFCQYGPTLSLAGRLSTSRKVMFVDHMDLAVKGPSETVPKKFDWFALQNNYSAASHAHDIKTPSKFVIASHEPYSYNIVFVDNERYAFMKSVISNIISAWQVVVETNPGSSSPELFKKFNSVPIAKEIDRILKSLCYWRPGRYQMLIEVFSQKESFSEEKSFTLDERGVDLLKENSWNIIATTCQQPQVQYHAVDTALYD